MRRLVVVMGVAGSGKSTVGRAVADDLALPFFEADDYHPAANRERMASGIALSDAQRRPWIDALVQALRGNDAPLTVLACSALTPSVRCWLEEGFPGTVAYILLAGSRELIGRRLESRKGHFAGSALLDSQFAALAPPAGALTVDVDQPLGQVIARVRQHTAALGPH